jgi:hypothetical protein
MGRQDRVEGWGQVVVEVEVQDSNSRLGVGGNRVL